MKLNLAKALHATIRSVFQPANNQSIICIDIEVSYEIVLALFPASSYFDKLADVKIFLRSQG